MGRSPRKKKRLKRKNCLGTRTPSWSRESGRQGGRHSGKVALQITGWVGTKVLDVLYSVCSVKKLEKLKKKLPTELNKRFGTCAFARSLDQDQQNITKDKPTKKVKTFPQKVKRFATWLRKNGIPDTSLVTRTFLDMHKKRVNDLGEVSYDCPPLIIEASKAGMLYHAPEEHVDISKILNLHDWNEIFQCLAIQFKAQRFADLQVIFTNQMTEVAEKVSNLCLDLIKDTKKAKLVVDCVYACLQNEYKLPPKEFEKLKIGELQATCCWNHEMCKINKYIEIFNSETFMSLFMEDAYHHFSVVFETLSTKKRLFQQLCVQLLYTLGGFDFFYEKFRHSGEIVTRLYDAMKDISGISREEKLHLAVAVETWIKHDDLPEIVRLYCTQLTGFVQSYKDESKIKWEYIATCFEGLSRMFNTKLSEYAKQLDQSDDIIKKGTNLRGLNHFCKKISSNQFGKKDKNKTYSLQAAFLSDTAEQQIKAIRETEPQFADGEWEDEYGAQAANSAEEEYEEEDEEEECGAQAANYDEEDDDDDNY